MTENVALAAATPRAGSGRRLAPATRVQSLDDISPESLTRLETGMTEVDRVLGGGLVLGSVVLIGGDPGIGKSTLLLQMLSRLGEDARVLYVTGEESAEQVALRAHRLGATSGRVRLLAETRVEAVLSVLEHENPQVVVIDSIQTLFTDVLQSAPGSVSQVRESAAQLVHYAKNKGASLFFVGHVTKEGALLPARRCVAGG